MSKHTPGPRPYDYSKASRLDDKARTLLAFHRRNVFDNNGELHERAIRRIQHLMRPHWQDRASYIAGQKLASMGY